MTRINCVPVEQLVTKHLVAEYRELPRVFALAKAWHHRGNTVDQLPKTYRMGKGHVMFFYDKLGWLVDRQRQLVGEMVRRGYNPQHTQPEQLLRGVPLRLQGGWCPTRQAVAVNRYRLQQKLGRRKPVADP